MDEFFTSNTNLIAPYPLTVTFAYLKNFNEITNCEMYIFLKKHTYIIVNPIYRSFCSESKIKVI